ncbi:zinc-binding dehydrogenase [Streptantibioticus parmotrematis]|uniref:zinc-binding dehydrogenase n=1 Tax=Streptantibioticus parmotrematis TaxID=2873249 RepID=UPI0027E1D9F8|nr:alcohol dehydrogenase catalytic domain-containing protein [Streptantibioticus parmotrematis]
MIAAVLEGPGNVKAVNVADATLKEPGDAVVRVVAAAICGTDIRGYRGQPGPVRGPRCGHEFLGVVEEVGTASATVRPGQLVLAPFIFADGTCSTCSRGLPSSCPSGGMFGVAGDGGQAEAVRVPFAEATLVAVAMDEHDERLPAVLALADVMPTGYHAVRGAHLTRESCVAVIGDGAVGLCSVLAAREAGAGRVIILGHHPNRLDIARRFGCTDVIESRGDEAAAAVADLTAGAGADLVVESVGDQRALDTALRVCADGGRLSLVGGPHNALETMTCFMRNITVAGGLTPARTYIPGLLDAVLGGRLDPSPVFDATATLADIAVGYEAMDNRQATKVLVRP